MARDPRWTVVLGGLLLVVAVVDAALVGPSHHLVPWVRTTLLVLALPIAIAGGLMTLRDLSPPPRSRRRR